MITRLANLLRYAVFEAREVFTFPASLDEEIGTFIHRITWVIAQETAPEEYRFLMLFLHEWAPMRWFGYHKLSADDIELLILFAAAVLEAEG